MWGEQQTKQTQDSVGIPGSKVTNLQCIELEEIL